MRRKLPATDVLASQRHFSISLRWAPSQRQTGPLPESRTPPRQSSMPQSWMRSIAPARASRPRVVMRALSS
jgi:hypothetical protein